LERIQSLRKRIDEIDEQILRSLKERMEACRTIGATKREHGIPIKDLKREEEQYGRIMKRAAELGLVPHEVKAVFREIIVMSVHLQESELQKAT
jgi:chorismate mutase